MKEKDKAKYELLKEQVKISIKHKKWDNNMFLQECINKIRGQIIIDENEEMRILDKLHSEIQFNFSGHIEWEKAHKEKSTITYEECNKLIENFVCYLVWSDADTPIVKFSGNSVGEAWDDIDAISFDFWIIPSDFSFVVESNGYGKLKMSYV